MKATEILTEEHRIILKVLDCLQKISDEAESNAKLDADSANMALEFFRGFADGCHHAKEEDRLFIVMQEQGIPRDGGPIGVMLTEHDHGRSCVHGMTQAVEDAAAGNRQAIEKFRDHAQDFIILLRAHIAKEDQVLFPMADNVLGHQGGEALLADFQKIESDAGGTRHADYIEMARGLCNRYGVPFVDGGQMKAIASEFL
ncbi:hemerythrin domain-containing protein, partial [bacterium]|nr:hemerythrin domain-containing protein [bacterium]